jgi:starch phosphorylase
MWQNLYPTLHKKEIPIISITNGAHLQTWLSLQMTEMFNRYVGPDYMHKAEAPELWKKIQAIPDGELWSAHRRRKEQTISFIRRRLTEMMRKRGYCKHKLKDVEAVLNPDYLTIGFARRFAQYKRPGLILSDPERLVSILTNEDRPVQLVFAGKAHPADGIGKGLIKNLIDFINEYPVEKHVVFLEDYDINVARHLVQGVDVWLNNPRKPMEASGTSGMKAGINGVLNLSVLDGWWPEAYNENNGWAINAGEHGETSEISDDAEANQIYEFLENEITGIFYDHREGEIPVEWVRMMKTSIATVARGFNMHRVMREYLYLTYLPQMTASKRLSENEWAELKKLEEYRRKLDKIWPKLYIKDYFTNMRGNLPVSGEKIDIECYVYLDDVDENRLQVESFYSFGDGDGETQISHLQFVEKYSDKVGKFVGDITVKGTGIQEVGVRLVPSDAAFREIYPEYVKWKD